MRWGWLIAGVWLAGGCRQLFGIDDTEVFAPADAAYADANGIEVPDAASVDAPIDDPIDATPDAPPDAASLCPAGYTDVGLGTYRIATTPRSWTQAEQDCANDTTAGVVFTHLVVLGGDSERSLVSSIAPGGTSWIGLSDLVTEGLFRWVTNEGTGGYPPPFGGPWDTGEPDNSGGLEDCTMMLSNGDLGDKPCISNTAYICECDAFPEAPGNF